MTSNLDYKKYSLDKLKEWVHDALSCGEASPHEIYSVLREAAQEDYQYYKDHAARAFGLLELMSGHRPVADAWEEHYYPEEYQYTATGEKWPSTSVKFDDNMNCHAPYVGSSVSSLKKSKKWVLPVEPDPSGEYFVTFPDDLLDAADLKEGDSVEWVDQGDGSYLLKKVVKPMTHDEMIAAGFTMTADGFWIKEPLGMDEC